MFARFSAILRRRESSLDQTIVGRRDVSIRFFKMLRHDEGIFSSDSSGDAFNGGFATALARGLEPLEAARFGCAVAGISVTRPGTAPSMPSLEEAEKVFRS